MPHIPQVVARMFFCASFAILLSSMPLNARAATPGIQMLPPLDATRNPCHGATGGILEWDGTDPVSCIPGFSGNVATRRHYSKRRGNSRKR